jgi:serine/threonine-protein phosphatase PGAM5
LTTLGRRQAAATARALRGYELDAIHCSTLPRAQETAAILKRALRSRLRLQPSASLREKLPTPVPGLTKPADVPDLRKNLATMQRAYARLARPARGERTELVVAHGNLIRLFVCLALRIKPTLWLKMHIHNGSITVLMIKDKAKGDHLLSFNETGHLAPKLRTYI